MARRQFGLVLTKQSDAWASNPDALVETPENTEGGAIVRSVGFTSEFGVDRYPPLRLFNFNLREMQDTLIDIGRHGILEWHAEQPYEHPCAVMGSDGRLYTSKQDSLNQNPTTDTTGTYWGQSAGFANAVQTALGDATDLIVSPATLLSLFAVNPNARWKATETKYGLTRVATLNEVAAGTSSDRVITPATLQRNSLAPLNSPALTGTPTAPTAVATDRSTRIATTAFVLRAIDGINIGPDSITLAQLRGGTSGTDSNSVFLLDNNADPVFGKIRTANIDNGQVTEAKIANGAVTNAKIADNAVRGNKIQDLSVTNQKIQNASVSNQKLANNSVGTSKVQDGSITGPKLANSAVTGDKIVNGAVTGAKLASSVGVRTLLARDTTTRTSGLANIPINLNQSAANFRYLVVRVTLGTAGTATLTAYDAVFRTSGIGGRLGQSVTGIRGTSGRSITLTNASTNTQLRVTIASLSPVAEISVYGEN